MRPLYPHPPVRLQISQMRVVRRDYVRREESTFDMHYPLTLGVVLKGRIRRDFPNYRTDCGPGQVFMTGPWEPHGWFVERGRCTVIDIGLLPGMLSEVKFAEAPDFSPIALFTAPPDKRPQMDVDRHGPMVRILKQMLQIYESDRPRKLLWLRSCLLQCLLLLYERFEPAGYPAPPPQPFGAPASPIAPALQLVFGSREFVSVAEAARACGLSRKTFAKTFAGLTGTSFPRFALGYRFQEAARQLVSSNDSVKKVAADWGFTDASHLHRCFVEHFGCTPVEYRARQA